MSAKPIAVWLERLLVIVGCSCITYYGYMTLEARQFQHEQAAAFEEALIGPQAAPVAPNTPAASAAPAAEAARRSRAALPADAAAAPTVPIKPVTPALKLAPGMLGILDIPRLGISSPVMSGDDDKTLDVAIGHLPDTPKPWERGNSAIAAHRDGLFKPLKNIRVGDDLRVRTLHGELIYEVRELKIVKPTDLSVLEPTGSNTLTLITCHPFDYVGNAPNRFIVRAQRVTVLKTEGQTTRN